MISRLTQLSNGVVILICFGTGSKNGRDVEAVGWDLSDRA